MTNAKHIEKRPSLWKVWLIASRPHTLTASISPVIVGYHIAKTLYPEQDYELMNSNTITTFQLFFQWLLFCILIQLGTNLHNDYADFVKGADDEKRIGQARATQKGWLTPDQTCRGCDICLIMAFSIGLQLAKGVAPPESYFDWWLMLIIVSSIFNAVAYTGGPYPLGYLGMPNLSIGYSGLGDIFVFLYFGLVATLTIPYLILRHSSKHHEPITNILYLLKPAFYLSLPVGFLATAIIVVNNLRDRKTDVGAGKRTLAVRFGATFCRMEYAGLVLASYLIIPILFLNTFQHMDDSLWLSCLCFLPCLSFIVAIPQIKAVTLAEKDFAQLNPHVGGTAKLQLLFCIMMSLTLRLVRI